MSQIDELKLKLEGIRANIKAWKEHEELALQQLNEIGAFSDLNFMLSEWYIATNDLKPMKEAESELRKRIFAQAFPEPKEGTNKLPLADGYVLNSVYGYSRTVQEDVFGTIYNDMLEHDIPVDMLVKFKPELKVTIYKALNAEQKAIVDKCLVTKPSSPTLEIVKPKRGA
jgi:hypothetical protein